MLPRTLVFDVNETLLDLAQLRTAISDVLTGTEHLAHWFFRLLHGSLVANATGQYRDFDEIAVEAARAVAEKQGRSFGQREATRVKQAFLSLPAHREVARQLVRLKGDGHTMVAFSNGSEAGLSTQLGRANLGDAFDYVISVEGARLFKPAPQAYEYMLRRVGSFPHDALMVAAHDWDIAGARRVKMGGAFVMRPGVSWTLPEPLPEVVIGSLEEL